MKLKEHLRPYGIVILIFASFGGVLFGYHTAVISGALVFLSPVFHLSLYDEGIVVSVMLIGALIGALMAGYLADRVGRRKTLLILAFLFIAGALLIAFSKVYVQLLAGRIVSGIAVGIVSVVTPLYLAEIAPPHLRGRCVSLFQFCISLGIVLAFSMAFLFSEGQNWEMLFFIGACFAFLQLLTILFIPETPYWMLSRGKNDLAIRTLRRLRKDLLWKIEIEEIHKRKTEKHLKDKKQLADFFKPHMPYILMVGFLPSIFQQITGVNAVVYYTPKIFQIAGSISATNSIIATFSVGIINCVATFFPIWMLDKIGRRQLLLIGSLGMAISLGILSFGFFSQSSAMDVLTLISLMAYMASFTISLGPVTWVILSEIFPLKIRGRAIAYAMGLNWLANFAVSMVFPDMIAKWGGGWCFAFFAMIAFVCFLFVYRFISETKGKSLEEIEISVRAGKF